MTMTRADHIAIAQGIANADISAKDRYEVVLNVLNSIDERSKGLNRTNFMALAFLDPATEHEIEKALNFTD